MAGIPLIEGVDRQVGCTISRSNGVDILADVGFVLGAVNFAAGLYSMVGSDTISIAGTNFTIDTNQSLISGAGLMIGSSLVKTLAPSSGAACR